MAGFVIFVPGRKSPEAEDKDSSIIQINELSAYLIRIMKANIMNTTIIHIIVVKQNYLRHLWEKLILRFLIRWEI